MILNKAMTLGGALALAACTTPGPDYQLSSRELLNHLPSRLSAFTAQGPATALEAADSAGRSYALPGAFSSIVLARAAPPQILPDGPDGTEARVLLERLTTLAQVRPLPADAPPRPGAAPVAASGAPPAPAPPAPAAGWHREADQGFRSMSGTALRCSVLRRPFGSNAQARYTCVTVLRGRFLTIVAMVNHDAMNGVAAHTLVGSFAAGLAEALSTGKGLVVPGPSPILT